MNLIVGSRAHFQTAEIEIDCELMNENTWLSEHGTIYCFVDLGMAGGLAVKYLMVMDLKMFFFSLEIYPCNQF
jgi:hypothetical protein